MKGCRMGRDFTYPATVTVDEAGFHLVSFPDVPEAHTDGPTAGEALAEATDCLDEAIAGRIARGEDIPSPSRPKGQHHLVALSALMAAKAALHLTLRDAGVSKSELARRLGVDEKEVRRMLDPKHGTKIPAIADALRVLGKTLVIGVRDAA